MQITTKRWVLLIVLVALVLVVGAVLLSPPSAFRDTPARDNPIAYVEIPVTDLARASRFYQDVFKFTLEHTTLDGYSMALFPSVPGGLGVSGALVKGDVYVPSTSGPIVYFGTEDIGAALARAQQAGGVILYPPKKLQGLGSVAEFMDSEGNRIALFAALR